ncbi:MAG TPA: hypothetical protein VF209_03115 [Patescibacteria group bacterium]
MNNLNHSISTIFLPNRIQQTDSHCGPAVMQSLLYNLNVSVTQDQIVEAAGVHNIFEDGTRPTELAQAVTKLAPHLQFWFKQYGCRHDLETLIHTHHWPVAVNWQGLFYDTPEEEAASDSESDHGHYSVVIDINISKDMIVISDPYSEYAKSPRIFSLQWFEQRWWDVANDVDPSTGEEIVTRTNHLMFLVAPREATFPSEIGMMLPDKLHILTERE